MSHFFVMDSILSGLDRMSDSLVLVPLVAYSFTVFAFLLASLVLPCDGHTPLLLTYVGEDECDFKLKSSLLDRKTEKYVMSPVTDFIEARQDDIAVDIGLLNEACEALDEVEALSRRTSVDSSTTTSSVLSASSLLTRPATAISFMTAPQQV